jgi:uncharacterized membrane protein YuzA (DUF378 family)
MKNLHFVAFSLAVIGALNWGLIGLFNYNLVNALLGSLSGLEKLVYILVGASGAVLVAAHKHDCKICSKM